MEATIIKLLKDNTVSEGFLYLILIEEGMSKLHVNGLFTGVQWPTLDENSFSLPNELSEVTTSIFHQIVQALNLKIKEA